MQDLTSGGDIELQETSGFQTFICAKCGAIVSADELLDSPGLAVPQPSCVGQQCRNSGRSRLVICTYTFGQNATFPHFICTSALQQYLLFPSLLSRCHRAVLRQHEFYCTRHHFKAYILAADGFTIKIDRHLYIGFPFCPRGPESLHKLTIHFGCK
jgi:hypothetical protein